MFRQENGKVSIINLIIFFVLIVSLYFAYQFYQNNSFNDFLKSEQNLGVSEFKRDENIKYSKNASYKIVSKEYNDAMFSKEIKLEKNTPYRVTCMVKTNNVESEIEDSKIGAQISITNTTERSVSVKGTNEWQQIELIFNSKNRDKVDIAFRLGGINGQAKGEAWFSDFSIEVGTVENDNNWKFACFIFENTNVEINGNKVDISVTDQDIMEIKDTIKRFENSSNILSKRKMKADCDIYEINKPISKLSYDEEFGYYVAPEDIGEQIKDTIDSNNYDHIFVIVKLGNEQHQNDIEIKDWIGLGAMDYYGIGFSNIRLPNDSRSYMYKYNIRVNQFPEEVFLHEFLHSLERTSEEYGYEVPALHDYEKYGYKNEKLIGQEKWYEDYMNQEVETTSGNVGLPEEIYTLKPAKKSNFENSYKLDEFKEPQNIIEEIQGIFKNFTRNVKVIVSRI